MEVTVQGQLVHAATGGRAWDEDEPAVILVHGAGLDRTIWQLQTRNIAVPVLSKTSPTGYPSSWMLPVLRRPS